MAVSSIFILIVTYIVYQIFKRTASGPLPPGPPRYPIIGSTLSMPTDNMWVTFSEWQKRFGNLIYLEALGRPILVLNKRADAIALLTNRSDVYSDRPHLVMIGEMCGVDQTWGMCPLGERLRSQQKLLSKKLTTGSITQYIPVQEDSVRHFILGILKFQNRDHMVHAKCLHAEIRTAVARIMFLMLYGLEINSASDKLLKMTIQSIEDSKDISSKFWIVDIFPLMKYLPQWTPGLVFPKVSSNYLTTIKASANGPYKAFKKIYTEASATGHITSIPSVCETIFHDINGEIPTDIEESLLWGTQALLMGGIDTTTFLLQTFFLIILRHPEIQTKAQGELYHVLGNTRLPTLEDRPNLPYLRSVITEILRWSPPFPLLIPRATSQDDIYKGYHFKKGTMIFCNIWNILHDPKEYQNPESFDPDRYNGDETAIQSVWAIVFGFGKRICPGRRLAENSLFLFISTILFTCDIQPVTDAKGNIIIPEARFTTAGGFPQHLAFDCTINLSKPLDMLH